MTTGNTPAAPYSVDVLLNHKNAVVSRIRLAPGAETPRHSHKHDYVVHPQAATKLLKTTYRAGQVVSQEQIDHAPNEPYYVFKSEDGTEFTIKNIGTSDMLCDKTQLPMGQAHVPPPAAVP